MEISIGVIVEGVGEKSSIPLLIRRVARSIQPASAIRVERVIRVSRGILVKPTELLRYVDIVAGYLSGVRVILIVFDSDDDCPAELGPRLLEAARNQRSDRHVFLVLACREYEAWLAAGIRGLRGLRGVRSDVEPPTDPESRRGMKEWFSSAEVMGSKYSSIRDQPAFTMSFDLESARCCPSFDKFWRDIERIMELQAPCP